MTDTPRPADPLTALIAAINDEADIRLADGRLAIARDHAVEVIRATLDATRAPRSDDGVIVGPRAAAILSTPATRAPRSDVDEAGRTPDWYAGYQAAMRDYDKRKPAPRSDDALRAAVPTHLLATRPERDFNLQRPEDFEWLAEYFSGYHGVPGLRAALATSAPPSPDVEGCCPVCGERPENVVVHVMTRHRESAARYLVLRESHDVEGLDDAIAALDYAIGKLPRSGSRMTQAAERRVTEALDLLLALRESDGPDNTAAGHEHWGDDRG